MTRSFLIIFTILLITQPAVASELESRVYAACMKDASSRCSGSHVASLPQRDEAGKFYSCLKQYRKICEARSGKKGRILSDATYEFLIWYFVIFSLLCGWCASIYAGKLRRNTLFWFCVGCFLTWMTVIWLFVLGQKEETEERKKRTLPFIK